MIRKEMKKSEWIFVAAYACILVAIAAGVFFYIRNVKEDRAVDNSKKGAEHIVDEVKTLGEVARLVSKAVALKKEMRLERLDTKEIESRLEDVQRVLKSERTNEAKEVLLVLISSMQDTLAREREKPVLAITFDAGAGAAPAKDLIAYLHESRVKITFFSTGKWAEQNPERFRELLVIDEETTNILGNHTYSHPYLLADGFSDEGIREEIMKTETIFKGLGFSAKPYFRYPYGDRDVRTDDIVADLGYVPVGWAFDSLGWKGTPAGEIVERVASKAKPGDIILMHVGSLEDVAAFPQIVERLKDTYRFVFVSEL